MGALPHQAKGETSLTWQATLTQAAADLTEPHTQTHQRWRWDHNNNKKPAGSYQLHLPALLPQLSVVTGLSAGTALTGTHAGQSPGPRPPVQLEALSAHAEISTAVMQWMGRLDQDWRSGGVLPNLRALAYVGWWSEPGIGRELTADVIRWRDTCLVLTGAEKVFSPRSIACPSCMRYGVLRINLTARAALCRACRSTWNTVGALAAQVSHDLRSVQVAGVCQ